MWSLVAKDGGHLIQCQIIVKLVGRILHWSLNASGQVVVSIGLTAVGLYNSKYR